jgi:uncharacterized membrane protein
MRVLGNCSKLFFYALMFSKPFIYIYHNLKPPLNFMANDKTWHQQHKESMTFGQKLADSVATGMGSWRFIIWQTIIVAIWMTLNVILIVAHRWDSYPFILLNLVFSTQAAYAAPIIMMAQNRAGDRDRAQADADYKTNCEAKEEIEQLQKRLNAIEIDKLDKIMAMLQEMKDKKA